MENKNEVESPAFIPETDFEVPESEDRPIAWWLILTYIVVPIWGICGFYLYFNGSHGWLDRGYWKQLQIAANTTFPVEDQAMPGGQAPSKRK